MFCKKCGTKFEEGKNVCANCGYVDEEIKVVENDEFFDKSNIESEEKKSQTQLVNVNAIIGFCLSFSFAILGLIFSVLGMKWANLNNGVGKKFAVAGLVLSIVFLALGLIEGIISCSLGFVSALETYNYSTL